MKLIDRFGSLILLVTIIASSFAFVLQPSQRTKQLSTVLHEHAVDKNVYSPDKLEPHYDAIVIGSGIGGLTAASLLAQAGKKVLVLEQHYVAGGCCHTFTRKGYEFATGIHYVGEMDSTTRNFYDLSVKQVMDSVTTAKDPLIWDRMDNPYDTVYLGDPPTQYEIVAGEVALKKKLIEAFPDEQGAIEKYYKEIKKVRAGAMKGAALKALPLRFSRFLVKTGLYRLFYKTFRPTTKQTVKDRLAELTSDKDLQALLAYNYPDYGTEPGRAPFFMQALLATHYLNGAYYPRGGPSSIPKKVIPTITDNGGQVLVSAPVKRIVLNDDSDTAIGVEMQDGQVIESDVVISDAGFMNTVERLLSQGIVSVDFAAEDSVTRLHPGTTGINLFVGIKGEAESLNLPKSNVWIHPTNDLCANAERINKMSLEEALKVDPKDLMVFVGCPPTKDSSWKQRHPGKCTLEVITLAPYRWFEKFESTFDTNTKSHGPEYEAAKTQIAQKMWERVVQVLDTAKLPKTLEEVDHFEVGSPLTFAHYYNSQRGSWYGLDMDLKRFEPETFFLRLRPEIPEVSNLYITGQDAMMDGLIGAAFGAVLCARKVLGVVNYKSLLRRQSHDDVADVDNEAEPLIEETWTEQMA